MNYFWIFSFVISASMVLGKAQKTYQDKNSVALTVIINAGPQPIFNYLTQSVCPYINKSSIVSFDFLFGFGAEERNGQAWCPDGDDDCLFNKIATCVQMKQVRDFVNTFLCCAARNPMGASLYDCLPYDETQQTDLQACVADNATAQKVLDTAKIAVEKSSDYHQNPMFLVDNIFDPATSYAFKENFAQQICSILTPEKCEELINN